MITALFQLDRRRAIVTFLPSFFLCNLGESGRLGVFRAFSRGMHLLRASPTHAGAAVLASSHLSAVVSDDVLGFDPGATLPRWAVDAVACLVLVELAIPKDLEIIIEQLIHMFEVDRILSATSRWHVRSV